MAQSGCVVLTVDACDIFQIECFISNLELFARYASGSQAFGLLRKWRSEAFRTIKIDFFLRIQQNLAGSIFNRYEFRRIMIEVEWLWHTQIRIYVQLACLMKMEEFVIDVECLPNTKLHTLCYGASINRCNEADSYNKCHIHD